MWLPASAYAESLVIHARAGTTEAARAAVARLGLRIAPITELVAEAAADLRARVPAIRLPDALVLACGEVLAADVILTADRRWRGLPRVKVVPE
jgi:predicted nucleic acid-binding protein